VCLNSWRFPIQFSFLCSGGYIAVLVLQQQLHSPSSLDGVWLLLEWLVGPFVGVLLAWLGWRDLERPALGHVWQRLVTGVFGAVCGAFGTMPFWDSLVGFPGTGIGIGLTVLLGCAFGWLTMLATGVVVILMTFAAASSLPAFSSNANAMSLLLVFTGSLTVFVPFGRAVQWVFNHANREVLVRRVDRALAVLTGQLEVADASSNPELTSDATERHLPDATDKPEALSEAQITSLPDPRLQRVKERAILELGFSERQVMYMDALVQFKTNKKVAQQLGVNVSEVKRELEAIYVMTGISQFGLAPVNARGQLVDWLKRHGFGSIGSSEAA
jgi:DNA-binding NarL/FixJ family response regulator